MKKRIQILLILVAATLLYRGLDVYYYFFAQPPVYLETAGISWHIENGRVTITAVQERYASGQPTPAFQAGLKKQDQVIAIYNARGEGRPIGNGFDYITIIKTLHFGEPWTLLIQRGAGPEQRPAEPVAMPPVPAPVIDPRIELVRMEARVVLPLIALITACLIGFMKPEDDNAFLASLLLLIVPSGVVAGPRPFPVGLREFFLVYSITSSIFSAYLPLRFFLRFPSPSWMERKWPWLKTVALYTTILIWIGALADVFIPYFSFGRLEPLRVALARVPSNVIAVPLWTMFLMGLVSLILNAIQAKTSGEKRRIRIFLTGMLFVLPVIPLLVSHRFPLWYRISAMAMAILFPLSFAYVVVKHRVFGIRVLLRRGLQYVLVARAFPALEAVLLIFIGLFALAMSERWVQMFPPWLKSAPVIGLVIMIFGLSTILNRINLRVMQAIDRHFFREAYNAQQILTDLGRAARRWAAQPNGLFDLVADKIGEALHPHTVAIFLRDAESPSFLAGGDDPEESLAHRSPCDRTRYPCYRLRTARGLDDATRRPVDTPDHWALSSDAVMVRYMEKFITEDPEALDVYLDDPQSWASALIKADSPADSRYSERVLLERLHTQLIVPLATNDRLLGFISLGEKMSEEPYSQDDKQLLLAVAGEMALAIDNAQLFRQVAEQEEFQRELEIAKDVQARLFPQTLPPMQNLSYTGICQPAHGVGGDYYDFLPIGPHKLGLALGDISGKGLSAALLMASLQALLRSRAPARGDALDELMGEINRLMYASTDTNQYATFFYSLYDETDRTLTYVNAGHNPPMLFRASPPVAMSFSDRLARRMARPVPAKVGTPAGEILRLQPGGTVVGLLPDSVYRQEKVSMRPGDILLVFTDGISEAMNRQAEEFGEARLAKLVAAHTELSAIALRDLILADVAEFVGEAPQHDDMTLVVAKVV